MKAIKDNATYVEKIVTQDDGDSDFAKVTDTTVNYIPNEIPLLDTTTNTQLESVKKLTENDEVLLIDTDNNITETKLGSVTTGTIDNTQTLDIFNDNSCIATYTFDDQNANDLSGNYNGTWNGTEAYEDGKFGKAAKFNGNSGIKVGQHNFSNAKSISLWFNWNGSRGVDNWATLLGSKIVSDDKSNNIKLAIYHHSLVTYHNVSAQWISSDSINSNTWYYVCIVENQNGNYDYYLNGSKIAEDLPDNNSSLDLYYIGSDNANGSVNEAFTGLIDQVRIFNRALTDDEVKQLYNEQITKYIADISSANLSEAPKKAFKKQLPSVSIAIEATKTDIIDTSFKKLTPKTTTYDGSKFTTVYSDLVKEGRVIQRKIVAPNKGIQVVEPFTSNLWKKG